MSNIGAGLGTSYPATLDTQTTLEVDSPSASKTLARAAVPNDLAAAVIAIETALGTTPQGSKADVKTFLQVEHGTNGTHQIQLTMAAGSAAAPQIKSATDAAGFFFPANVVGVSIAGTERGRFTSTGLNNCAIGVTTPQAGFFTTITASGNITGTATAATTVTVNSDPATNVAYPVVFSNGTGAGSTLKGAVGEFEYNPATNTLTLVTLATGGLSITQGPIISGSYTPTATVGTPHTSYYMRVGNMVTVTGAVTHTTSTVCRISLPISTTFSDGSQISGSCYGYNESTNTLYSTSAVFADVSGGDTNQVTFMTGAGVFRNNFHFTYLIA